MRWNWWEKVLRPAAFRLDAERAHELGIKALEIGVGIPSYPDDGWDLGPVRRFGLEFKNPIGLAAGFDKNAVAVRSIARLGFGFVEVGTITDAPQPGNERPRMFRLPDDEALINRLGFNNKGAASAAARLRDVGRPNGIVIGVNIGRNKHVPNDRAIDNYLAAFEKIRDAADYVAINVSSPNTPELRELQQKDSLNELLSAIQTRNQQSTAAKPILIKIAPDITDSEIDGIAAAAKANDVAGIIATNTTVSRSGLKTTDAGHIGGGLSGKPLAALSTEIISKVYRATDGKMPIIGVGGISTAEDALEKVLAGASLLQAYTGFIYAGPSFARDLNRRLASLLRERGFSSLDEAVGAAFQ